LGTSLTEEQAALIKRFSDLCYITYDADGAGQEASIRGMYILQRRGVEVRVVVLPPGMDPDDALSAEGGTENFERLIKEAMPLPLYHVHIRKGDLQTPERQMKARDDVYDGLSSLSWLDVQKYIPKIAVGFAMRQDEVENEIRTRRNKAKKSVIYAEGIDPSPGVYNNDDGSGDGKKNAGDRVLDLECAMCSLLWRNEELRENMSMREMAPLFFDEAASGIAAALLSGESQEELESRWRSMGERLCPERIARGDAVLAEGNLGVEHLDKIVESMRGNMMRRRYEQLKPRIFSEEATDGEIAEYREWAKKLKGRSK
jgi:DNA primase